MRPPKDIHLLLEDHEREKYRYNRSDLLDATNPFQVYKVILCESYPLHWLEFFEIGLVTEGHGIHMINGMHHPLEPGTVFLLSPADFHAVNLKEGAELSLCGLVFDEIILNRELCYWLFQNRDNYHLLASPDRQSFLENEFHLIHQEWQRAGPMSHRLVSGALERILVFLGRECGESTGMDQNSAAARQTLPVSMQQALLYIHHHFRQPLRLEDAASRAGLSPNYFSERFHRLTGTTFQTYLQALRLQFAARLLTASDLPVSEILLAAGFNDLSHFGRVFRKAYGVSPRIYRQNTLYTDGRHSRDLTSG